MSDFDVEINDAELQRIISDLQGGHLDDWLAGLAEQAVGDMKLSMGDSPNGNQYWRGNKIHYASIASFPPNVDTGALRASLHTEKRGDNDYIIADGVEYGIHLELGTENMEARPFMRPIILQLAIDILRNTVDGDVIP
ncbi:MAG: hypothetical protein RLP44_02525 [Aggregatilineales bacterium]